jgi:hypothetical protein
MTHSNKLRVATADMENALELVTVEVERATGFAVQPVLQEIDRADLVVELRLPDSDAVDSRHIACAVERTASNLDVLSNWIEASMPAVPAPASSESVLDVARDPMPEVAQRALRDQIPTAQWLDIRGGTAEDDRSCWVLAVPVMRSDGHSRVGVRRRHGYSLRFSAYEATTTQVGVGSRAFVGSGTCADRPVQASWAGRPGAPVTGS